MNKSLFQRVQEWFIKKISPIKWKQKNPLTDDDRAFLRDVLSKDYFIIAIRRSNYLTAFFIDFGNFLLTGRWGYFTHVFMNLENDVKDDSDFRFIEATTLGTEYTTFDQAFEDVDGVALLKPHSMTLTEWTECLDAAKKELGKPYDTLFDLKNDLEVNCVELIRIALKALPDYDTRFANLEKMIQTKKEITPEMIVDCEDFHIYYMIRKF
jgi:hypothetical protein